MLQVYFIASAVFVLFRRSGGEAFKSILVVLCNTSWHVVTVYCSIVKVALCANDVWNVFGLWLCTTRDDSELGQWFRKIYLSISRSFCHCWFSQTGLLKDYLLFLLPPSSHLPHLQKAQPSFRPVFIFYRDWRRVLNFSRHGRKTARLCTLVSARISFIHWWNWRMWR